MKCPNCKAKLNKEDKFCPNCDFKIKSRIEFKKIHFGFAIILVFLLLAVCIGLKSQNKELNNKNTELNNRILNSEHWITLLNENIKEKKETIAQLETKINELEGIIDELSQQKVQIKYQCLDGTTKEKLEDCSQGIEIPTQKTTFGEKEFWNVFCDTDATDLQKQNMFDRYKNKYITTTGEIEIIHTDGEVYLTHCDGTWTWDIEVEMQSNQIERLLGYKEGDTMTYKARLTTFNPHAILSSELSADDGEVIS